MKNIAGLFFGVASLSPEAAEFMRMAKRLDPVAADVRKVALKNMRPLCSPPRAESEQLIGKRA